MPNLNKKLAVLVSGLGTNLQAIIDSIKSKELPNTEISIVISNKKDAYALVRAKNAGVKTLFLNPKDFQYNFSTKGGPASGGEHDKKLIEEIKKYNVDLIVLAGYLRILPKTFINTFKDKIINIHPALLPNFGGKGMYGEKVHEAVLKSGAKESGCTVHFVDTGIDTGQIISQKKVPVLNGDTVETLSKRILKEEHKLIVEGIKKILFEYITV